MSWRRCAGGGECLWNQFNASQVFLRRRHGDLKAPAHGVALRFADERIASGVCTVGTFRERIGRDGARYAHAGQLHDQTEGSNANDVPNERFANPRRKKSRCEDMQVVALGFCCFR